MAKRQKTSAQVIEIVRNEVCSFYNIDHEAIMGKKRIRSLAWPRQVMMYILFKHTTMSFLDIAKATGRVDHTTACHAVDRVGRLMNITGEAEHIEKIEEAIMEKVSGVLQCVSTDRELKEEPVDKDAYEWWLQVYGGQTKQTQPD